VENHYGSEVSNSDMDVDSNNDNNSELSNSEMDIDINNDNNSENLFLPIINFPVLTILIMLYKISKHPIYRFYYSVYKNNKKNK
jgi:hypothetical protein